MGRILFMCLDAAFAAVLLLPLFCLLNRRYFHSPRRTVLYFLMAVYLCAMYAVVGLPDIRYMRLDFHCNLIPFAYMFSDYRSSSLNVLLFLPLGIFLPVLWQKFHSARWALLFGLGLSLFIECLQIFTFRASDVNDLITNTFGTFLGWCLGMLTLRLFPGLTPGTNTREVLPICAASFGVMFFFQPFLADFIMDHFL